MGRILEFTDIYGKSSEGYVEDIYTGFPIILVEKIEILN